MIHLFIDTASKRRIVALCNDDKILCIRNEENGHDLAEKIMLLVDEVFQSANLTPQDVDDIYVVNGPGSFTGVRVGVTIAKTMAWALHKKIVTLSELELLATTKTNTEYILSYIDARRNASFAGIYKKDGTVYLQDQYIANVDLMKLLPNSQDITCVSYDSTIHLDTLAPEVDILEILKRHKRDVSLNPHEVNPEYLKLTEAEENLARGQRDH